MSKDLLAPPKITRRMYAIGVVILSALLIVTGLVFMVFGRLTIAELAVRSVIVVAISVLAAWAYSWLLAKAGTARPERMPYIHAGISFMGLAAFYAGASVMLWGTGLGGGSYAWMIPGLVGMTLATGGWGRRVGESLHCPKCEYEFAFAEADAPKVCPECATPWLGQLRKGRPTRSYRMMSAGIALALFGMIAMQPVFWVGPLAKVLPTPVLYIALYAEPKSLYTSWEELAARPLGQSWIDAMADRVLHHRTRHQWDTSGSIWFEAMMTSARMPATKVDRFYRDGFRASLDAPSQVRAGKPFKVRFRTTRALEGWGTKLGVMFGGYAINDEPPVGRAPEAVWGYLLRPRVFSRHRDHFEQTFTIAAPGTHRIRATYWVIYQPSFWPLPWGTDGAPVKPAAALWYERIDTEATINVR